MKAASDEFVLLADMLDPPKREWVGHEAWLTTNLPQLFSLPFGPHHRDLASALGPEPAGVRKFDAAPRGSGKTTIALVGLPISCVAQGTHEFIVVVRVTQEHANTIVESIGNMVERHPELAERWPNLKIKKRIRGVRDAKNVRTEIRFVGGTIIALGAGGKLRGLIRPGDDGGIMRPDLFLFDDLEDAEQARSKLRTDRLEEWIFADVSNLGGNLSNAPMDVIGIGTTIDTDAMATRAIKGKGRFSAWDTKSFPAEYVDEHGGRVAMWPQGQPLDYLDRLLDPTDPLFIGSFSYAKEYLLNPRKRADALVRQEWLRYGRTPELKWLSVGIDPSTDEASTENEDYSALAKVGMDPDGYVWVQAVRRGHWSQRKLFDRCEELALDDAGNQEASVAFEAIAGFAWGVQELRRRGLAHRPIKRLTDKVERFRVVALAYEAGIIVHDESLRGSEFEDELLDFPGGEHDDMVDALYHAYMLATNAGRRAWENRRKGDEERAHVNGNSNGHTPNGNGRNASNGHHAR